MLRARLRFHFIVCLSVHGVHVAGKNVPAEQARVAHSLSKAPTHMLHVVTSLFLYTQALCDPCGAFQVVHPQTRRL